MWRNYLTVGLRALAKNKTYAFINIFGLTLGLAATLLILLYVRYETSYDSWLPDAERTFQLQNYLNVDEGAEADFLQGTSYVSGQALKKDFAEVEAVVHLRDAEPVVIRNGQPSPAPDAVFVDGPFLDVVRLPLARGTATALSRPGMLLLTESEARRRFGAEDPLGQTLTLVDDGHSNDYLVTGILKDLPRNSHLRFTIVARYDPARIYEERPHFFTHWGWQSGWVYARLREGADAGSINAALPAWEKRNIPDIPREGGESFNHGTGNDWRLVNVRDVHLGHAQGDAMTPGNDRKTIATFTIAALLILCMGCVNFVNLATARASQRAREVALRKVLGARRKQLVAQFIGESMLVSILSMVTALALIEVTLPAFRAYTGIDLALEYVGDGGILLPIFALVLIVGAAGGFYPALYLSRFQPAAILKANVSSAEARGSERLRQALVVAQFAISIALIICTAIIYSQMMHARTLDAGYRRDGLIQIANMNQGRAFEATAALVREVRAVPGVETAGVTEIGVATDDTSSTSFQAPGSTEARILNVYDVDDQFFDAMGIRVLAGRPFSRTRVMDDATSLSQTREGQADLVRRGMNIVVNELAAQRLGFAQPADAIGRQVKAAFVDSSLGMVPATIVGVVSNVRFRSVRDPVEPISYVFSPQADYMVVRYAAADPRQVLAGIEATWKRIAPDVPFQATFAGDIVRDLYDAEEARGHLFAGFAIVALSIACLGLFGLAAFTAERRTKEIGIRKVLGARSRDIVRLLAWQFSKPVIIANIIAWPIAWWVMRDWLNTFDARIDLTPLPFVLAGVIALGIAIGTIAGHALKVARANPIHALRYE